MKKYFFILIALLCVATVSYADFGRTTTRRERGETLRRELSSPRQASGAYEAIQNAFLNKNYSKTVELCDVYLNSLDSKEHLEDVLNFQAFSLLKLGRTMEARSRFRTLEERSSNLNLKAAASASLGDTYYFEKDWRTARERYEETLAKYPTSDQTIYIQSRLSEMTSRPGSGATSGFYRPLKQVGIEESGFYSVQVGSFSKKQNAQGLLDKILASHSDAYVQKDPSASVYRVRVGRLSSREDALRLETSLKKEGYPTKISS